MNVRRLFVAPLLVAAVASTLVGVVAKPVAAAPLVELAVPATATASYNFPVDVSGITLTSGGLPSIQVQLTVDHGTLSMTTTSGLTFVPGQGSGTSNVQFTGTPANVQNALSTLRYTPANNYTGADTLTYNTSPGGGLYNPDNGHFYEFVEHGSNISWTAAKTAAGTRTFAGMTGYLATVTSASEQAFVSSKLQGQGWFAASDANVEGIWTWADGPEDGQEFWQGTRSSSNCVYLSCTATSGRYNNWASGEPNDAGGEDYAHFLDGGEWNDYPDSASITKYLTEYGGGLSDPDVIDTQATAITVAVTAPGVSTNVQLTPGDTQTDVSWTAPTNTGGASIDHYLVEYSTDGGSSWTSLPTTASTSATITSLQNGTAVQVRVSAHNSVGYGATTTPVSTTPFTTATAPQSLVLTPDDANVTASWTAPTSDGGSAITGYRVEYSTDGTTFTTAATGVTSPYSITSLTNGTSYTIRVFALNAAGAGTPAAGVATAGGLASAPQTVVATSADKAATITWAVPASTGGLPVTGYKVEYSSNGTQWTVASASTISPYTITGLTNGTQYQVRVSALNLQGAGATASATVTPLGVPSPATGVAVVTTPVVATVTWNAPTDNGGTAITGYTLEYRSGTNVWLPGSTSATSPYEITGLTPGTAYEVRVIAKNAVGAAIAAVSTFTTKTPPAPGVSAPIRVDNGTVTTVPAFDTKSPVQVTAPTPSGNGSWALTPDGGVFTAGDAQFYGSMGNATLNSPAVNIAPTANGGGYYVVAADGGVFAFGDAQFQGSMGGQPLNAPVTAIAPSCTKNGYYLVASDGGVFAFGDAGFYGSMGGQVLNQPMLGIVDSSGRNGSWTFARDGGVFTFGDAEFYGSLGSNPPAGGIIAMVSAPDGRGYWLVGADKKAYGFGSVG